MLVSNSGRDAASQAALRLLMERLPRVSAIDGSASVEPMVSSDPPVLRAAQLVEGSMLRAIPVAPGEPRTQSGFGAFLDGAQRVQIMGHHEGIPIVYATTSAAIRVRVNRRMVTWGHRPPRVERQFFLPLRYLPSLGEITSRVDGSRLDVVDTAKADQSGAYPSLHPTALLDRALSAVAETRERLEHELAEVWCASVDAPIFIDGGISGNPRVAASPRAIGVVKSHRTLFVEGDALRIVFGLAKGERSSVFRVSPRSRSSVVSWYLRVRDPKGHDAMWGLVRVEVSESDRHAARADEISRWIMAEMTPLSLPDGRWDKMAYGIRDCEEFLRAIS
ncbi:MAG TPA: hypothetical protein VNO75_11240 [Gemmatimonadaceae bacterium]|nr:hypothetical protein [Gemmatimonadaceae bacterium]